MALGRGIGPGLILGKKLAGSSMNLSYPSSIGSGHAVGQRQDPCRAQASAGPRRPTSSTGLESPCGLRQCLAETVGLGDDLSRRRRSKLLVLERESSLRDLDPLPQPRRDRARQARCRALRARKIRVELIQVSANQQLLGNRCTTLGESRLSGGAHEKLAWCDRDLHGRLACAR